MSTVCVCVCVNASQDDTVSVDDDVDDVADVDVDVLSFCDRLLMESFWQVIFFLFRILLFFSLV